MVHPLIPRLGGKYPSKCFTSSRVVGSPCFEGGIPGIGNELRLSGGFAESGPIFFFRVVSADNPLPVFATKKISERRMGVSIVIHDRLNGKEIADQQGRDTSTIGPFRTDETWTSCPITRSFTYKQSGDNGVAQGHGGGLIQNADMHQKRFIPAGDKHHARTGHPRGSKAPKSLMGPSGPYPETLAWIRVGFTERKGCIVYLQFGFGAFPDIGQKDIGIR
jgi:hypothetical protein